MSMKLVNGMDPTIRVPCEKFNFMNPQVDMIELVDNMVRTMYDNYGLGLSANQVGVPLQVFVMAAQTPVLVINPRILEYSSETVELEETCLSLPGHVVKVRRPIWIKVRYNTGSGKAQTFRYEGMTSRIFQHQCDIINGITMLDKLSKLKRDMHIKKMRKVKG